MSNEQNLSPDDTARIDLRELEASGHEADLHALLLSIGAAEFPHRADPTSTPTSPAG